MYYTAVDYGPIRLAILPTLNLNFFTSSASYELSTHKQLFKSNLHVYTMNYIIAVKLYYVTGFWKIGQIFTLGLSHFIGPAINYTHTLPIHSAITRLS